MLQWVALGSLYSRSWRKGWAEWTGEAGEGQEGEEEGGEKVVEDLLLLVGNGKDWPALEEALLFDCKPASLQNRSAKRRLAIN